MVFDTFVLLFLPRPIFLCPSSLPSFLAFILFLFTFLSFFFAFLLLWFNLSELRAALLITMPSSIAEYATQ